MRPALSWCRENSDSIHAQPYLSFHVFFRLPAVSWWTCGDTNKNIFALLKLKRCYASSKAEEVCQGHSAIQKQTHFTYWDKRNIYETTTYRLLKHYGVTIPTGGLKLGPLYCGSSVTDTYYTVSKCQLRIQRGTWADRKDVVLIHVQFHECEIHYEHVWMHKATAAFNQIVQLQFFDALEADFKASVLKAEFDVRTSRRHSCNLFSVHKVPLFAKHMSHFT